MVNAKAIGLIALLAIGLSSGIGGYLGSQYVDQELQDGINEAVPLPALGEEGYEGFVSNEDADAPTFRKYYFWNLTNSQDYLDGAEPIFEEIGPYVYQEFKIKFNIDYSSDESQVSYQTYTYYQFSASQSFEGASESDKIVNINPAYLGVIDGAGSEYALVTGFVGPAMQSILAGLTGDFDDGVAIQGTSVAVDTIFDGLTGDFTTGVIVQGQAQVMAEIVDGLEGDFTDGVILQGSAQALEGIENAAVEDFEFAINATTAANVIKGNYDGIAGATTITNANAALFNDTTMQDTYATTIEGVSERMTGGLANLGYTNDTITKFLYDGITSFGTVGIFDDLTTGSGVLGYLEVYDKSINEEDGLDNATLQFEYGASQPQLDAMAGYLAQYLIEDNAVIAGAYEAGNSGQTTQEGAFTNLYSQWVNATFIPTGLDVNGDDTGDDGFEISIDTDYGIDNATVTQLFNVTNPYSLTNSDTGIFTWIQAIGNVTLQTLLETTYTGINGTEFGAIYAWLAEFVDQTTGLGANLALNQIAVTSGLAPGEVTADNLGYLHWATANVTGGITLDLLDTSLPTAPEVWAVTGTEFLSLDDAEGLLGGNTLNLTTTTGMGFFLQEAQKAVGGNVTALALLNGGFSTDLNTTELGLLLSYLSNPIADVFLLGGIAQATGETFGTFTTSDIGYLHWANPGVTGGVNLTVLDESVTVAPEFWAFSGETLNLSDAKALMTTPQYNLTTALGVGFFLQEGQKAIGGNSTALGTINAVYGTTFNATQVGLIVSYFADWIRDVFVFGSIAEATGETYGTFDTDDLGYLHWANPGVTGGETLDQLSPEAGLPGSVSLWDNAGGATVSLADARALLTTATGLSLTSTDGVGFFLQQAAQLSTAPATAVAAINTAFGSNLTASQAGAVATYIGYIQQVFVVEATLQPIFDMGGGLVTSRNINQWLFSAQDPLLAFLQQNGQDIPSTNAGLFTNATSQDDPRIAPASLINTGRTNVDQVLQYIQWQGQTEITVWENTENIEGTDATQFAPGVSSDQDLKAYVSDLLRVIDFTYDEDINVKGIDALRYVIPESVLDVNSNYYQSTKGVANMSIAAGIDLFLSKPHFLDAAVTLLDGVNGLSPNADDHDTYLGVEPLTGAVIDARKRLQINLNIEAGNFITTGVTNTMMPVVWVEEGGTIPDDSARSFIDTIYGAQELSLSFTVYGFLAAGILSVLAGSIMLRPKVD